MLQVLVPTTITVAQKPMLPKKEPGIRAKDTEDSGGPTTTVFVGNISEKASDMLVRQLLAVSCTHWNAKIIGSNSELLRLRVADDTYCSLYKLKSATEQVKQNLVSYQPSFTEKHLHNAQQSHDLNKAAQDSSQVSTDKSPGTNVAATHKYCCVQLSYRDLIDH